MLVFLLGAIGGYLLSGLKVDFQEQALRRQAAAWRKNHAAWIDERISLQAERDRLRHELMTARAWVDRLEHTLTLSHDRMAEIQSDLQLCERLVDTVMATPKR